MAERTTVRLPEDLVRRAKNRAASEGRSLTALIEEALRQTLKEPSKRPGPRVLPPVSSASGGLRPGIDLSNSAQLQELDDLEYATRLS